MNKLSLCAVFLFSVTASASEDIVTKVANCKSISSVLERLACFDAINVDSTSASSDTLVVKDTGKQLTTPTEIEEQLKKQPEAEAVVVNKNEFGLKQKKSKEADSISFTISKIKKNAYGKITVYSDQGQVWKQIDSLSFRGKVGDTVVVKEAFFGSYFMKKPGSSQKMRVKRIK